MITPVAVHHVEVSDTVHDLIDAIHDLGAQDLCRGAIRPVAALQKLVEARDLPLGAEHAVGDDHPRALVLVVLQLLLQVGHVGVLVRIVLGLREPDAVDDAGVVVGVAVNGVAGVGQQPRDAGRDEYAGQAQAAQAPGEGLPRVELAEFSWPKDDTPGMFTRIEQLQAGLGDPKDGGFFVAAVSDVYGYEELIPTHQGRGAEHLLSQILIEPGDIVHVLCASKTMRLVPPLFHVESVAVEVVIIGGASRVGVPASESRRLP